MCFCSFGVKKKGGEKDVFPPKPGERTCKFDVFRFFSDASGFSVKKDPTIFHCLSMFVAIFLIFPLKATGLLAQGTRVGAARSACPQCWLPWRNFQSESGCLAQSRASEVG